MPKDSMDPTRSFVAARLHALSRNRPKRTWPPGAALPKIRQTLAENPKGLTFAELLQATGLSRSAIYEALQLLDTTPVYPDGAPRIGGNQKAPTIWKLNSP